MKEPERCDSTNSGSSPKPGSLLEELLAKISLRNIPSNQNSKIPEATQNSKGQYKTLAQSHNSLTSSSTTTTTTTMERRNWPEIPDRLNKPRPEFGVMGNEIQPPFCNGKVLPPLRNSDYNPLRNVTKVDTSNHFLPSNARLPTPIVKARPSDGYQFQQRQPIPPIQSYGRQQQKWLESNRRQNPMTNNNGEFHSREHDNFHLPPIALKQNQNNYSRNQERPMTACPQVSSSRPFSAVSPAVCPGVPERLVSNTIRMFEGNSTTNFFLRPDEHEVVRQISLEMIQQERANQIHPSDDGAVRIGKMRRTCQKFDQSNFPYERSNPVDGLNGANEGIGRQESNTPYQHFYHNSQGYIPDNGNHDRPQLNVTAFRAAAKKPSKTRVLGGRSQSKKDYVEKSTKDPPSPPPIQINIQEFEPAESSKPKPRKTPSWVKRSVENGSDVTPSVCGIWESVNLQVRSKLLQGNDSDSNMEEDNYNTG